MTKRPHNDAVICFTLVKAVVVNDESIANSDIQRFYGNLSEGAPLPPNWKYFKDVNSELHAFSAKWLVHMGHGATTEWAITLGDNRQIDNAYVQDEVTSRWNVHDMYSFPIILSAGCDTGQLLPNAPFNEYRGLNPDVAHWIWYYTDSKTAEDKISNTPLPYPVMVPVPVNAPF